jgi:hypothetical protein
VSKFLIRVAGARKRKRWLVVFCGGVGSGVVAVIVMLVSGGGGGGGDIVSHSWQPTPRLASWHQLLYAALARSSSNFSSLSHHVFPNECSPSCIVNIPSFPPPLVVFSCPRMGSIYQIADPLFTSWSFTFPPPCLPPAKSTCA